MQQSFLLLTLMRNFYKMRIQFNNNISIANSLFIKGKVLWLVLGLWAGTSVAAYTQTYCSSAGNMTYATGITLVRFNTITNVTAKPAAYTDYTGTQTTTVIRGTTYSGATGLTANLNTDGNFLVNAMAWIDWNDDGDFIDAGESYSLGTTTNNSNGQTTLSPVSITVPANAAVGTTRMRVAASFDGIPTSCGIGFDGEVEDYTIVIQPFTATAVITGATCGSANGSIVQTVTGGTAPYTYAWTGGATTKDRTGLAAGTYNVTITKRIYFTI